MRTRLSVLLFGLATLPFACDPGSSESGGPDGSQNTGGAEPAELPALLKVPREPPGEVNLEPPAAGELDAAEQNRALGRGINLGNALDGPSEGAWGVTLAAYMFEVIAQSGFDSIRLPVRWPAHADPETPYTIDESFFERVDWAVAHALTRNLRVVLNIHHYDNQETTSDGGIYSHPQQEHDRFLALWRQIAEHYAEYPKELYFEILNEPRGALDSVWNDYQNEAIQLVRESNPGRTLIVGGGEYNKWYTLEPLTFPVDERNLIATFHYYNPYCFTLQQNATWDQGCGSGPAGDWPVLYPNTDPEPETTRAEQLARLKEDLDGAAAWSEGSGIPLYMGEFGVDRAVATEARVAWTEALARGAEERSMSWAYWEFCSGMGAFLPSTLNWSAPLIEALIPDYDPPAILTTEDAAE